MASERRPGVFYFPSYEVIAAHPKSAFYEDDLRAVTPEGIEAVMKLVREEIIDTACVPLKAVAAPAPPVSPLPTATLISIHESSHVICDEEMLARPAAACA